MDGITKHVNIRQGIKPVNVTSVYYCGLQLNCILSVNNKKLKDLPFEFSVGITLV
jgi:hypothetical protein